MGFRSQPVHERADPASYLDVLALAVATNVVGLAWNAAFGEETWARMILNGRDY
jgi:hypothetical protein